MFTWKETYHRLTRSSRQEGTSFAVILWLFISGSLLGFVGEGVFHLIRKGTWAFRVGTLWGPFCVLYGFGVVVMYLVALGIQRKKLLPQFLIFALTGSAVELASGIFQQAAFGTKSWDYASHALNLGGYVSLKMTLLWGMAGIVLMYAILPLLLSAFNRLQLSRRTLLCRATAVMLAFNLLMTACALLRWQERVLHAVPASNRVEAYLDARWPDERMQERFPNMEFVSLSLADVP